MIDFEEFKKLDLRIAKIISAEGIEGTDKLLKLKLDVGNLGKRTVVSGIKRYYNPKDLVGKLVVYLSNLKPKTFKGVESQGMVLAAISEDEAILLSPEKSVLPGAKII